LKLRILTTSYLEQAHYYRGEYEQVIEFATANLAMMPADWVHEYFGMAVPSSVFARGWLIMSLAELGRFDEAAKYTVEVIQIAEPTQHAFTMGWAHFAASMFHLLKGDWATASSLAEQWIVMLRTGNLALHLPWAVASSALALAQIGEGNEALNRVREAELLLEGQAARGIVGHRGWAYSAASRACLLLQRLDDAQRLGQRAAESTQRQPGFSAHAQRLLGDIAAHPDCFDAEKAATHYRGAMAVAKMRGMLPLVAHCHLGLGRIYRRTGEIPYADENLAIARTMYGELDLGFWFDPKEST
jgi:tetratricopeptide (TPR) repeat protein